MLLKLAEELPLNAPIDEVWKLLRDTSRLTGLLPGVDNVERLQVEGEESYSAKVSEKIGPFKITMNLEVTVTETVEAILVESHDQRRRFHGTESHDRVHAGRSEPGVVPERKCVSKRPSKFWVNLRRLARFPSGEGRRRRLRNLQKIFRDNLRRSAREHWLRR